MRDEDMGAHPTSRRRSLAASAAIVLTLALLCAALPPSGFARRPPPEPSVVEMPRGWHPDDPLYRVDLPYEEPHVPAGPNQQQFTASCRLCHSPRLVLTQPRLTEKKWGEVVHKMVGVYGAQLSAQQEREIVDYLTTVHGRRN